MRFKATCACGYKNQRATLSNLACSRCLMPIPHYMWQTKEGQYIPQFFEQLLDEASKKEAANDLDQ